MLIPESEALERLESPSNLMNRLRAIVNPHSKTVIPTIPPPTASDIIPNLDEKISYTSTKQKAMAIMNSAMNELQNRLPEVQRPEKLAAIAAEMGKIVIAQNNQSITDNRIGQIIVYSPRIVSEEQFETVDMKGIE